MELYQDKCNISGEKGYAIWAEGVGLLFSPSGCFSADSQFHAKIPEGLINAYPYAVDLKYRSVKAVPAKAVTELFASAHAVALAHDKLEARIAKLT